MRAGYLPRGRAPVVAAVAAALAVELADELVDGVKSAALPLIRGDLGLSYGQIGLLAAVPLLAGSLIELPVGVLAGGGQRRRRVALAGGLVFIAALLAAALAASFGWLLAAFVLFFPASGAFVSLTQAALMDAGPARREQLMARWTLAGGAGAVVGPLLLAAVVGAGGSWRTAYLALAVVAAAAWLILAGHGRPLFARTGGASPDSEPESAGLWAALRALRGGAVLRWVVLLEVADLLLDVLTGFVALYLVAAGGVTAGQAALGVGVRLAADLAGTAALIPLLARFSGLAVLRVSALAAAVAYPAFLLVPGFWAKVAALAVLSVATSAWYPVLQAQLYASLPGASGVAVSLQSAAGLAAAAGPLAVGFLAERLGLSTALALLAFVPLAVLAGAIVGGRAGQSGG
jgi:FSR family fosmidomycin resistance protein-like MFS transporter